MPSSRNLLHSCILNAPSHIDIKTFCGVVHNGQREGRKESAKAGSRRLPSISQTRETTCASRFIPSPQTAVHLFHLSTSASRSDRCFPFSAGECESKYSEPVQCAKSYTANAHREDRPAVFPRPHSGESGQVRRLCHSCATSLYDTRQLMASGDQVHVHWCFEDTRSQTDCYDLGP